MLTFQIAVSYTAIGARWKRKRDGCKRNYQRWIKGTSQQMPGVNCDRKVEAESGRPFTQQV